MRFPEGMDGRLGPEAARILARLEAWRDADFVGRLRRRDPTLWFPGPVPEVTDRLGWLDLPEATSRLLESVRAFVEAVRAEGIRHVVLLGMGGSSLAPDMFRRVFGRAPGHPDLIVLDSLHPAAVRAVERRLDPAATLFLVSSKSGTTVETVALFRFFWERVRANTGGRPGHHFAAITDPGTPLERTARERGFRHVFLGPPDVGGRYSALSVFGLVPAALVGIDVARLLESARAMAEACGAEPGPDHPSLFLGAALGEWARAGRDKVTFWASPSLRAFPTWLEQLIAESTGKDGRGIVPVVDEPLGDPDAYGTDRCFICLDLAGEADADAGRRLSALAAAGHPVLWVRLRDRTDLGGECFRWEMAVAAACAVLGVHPFDQPDVQRTKDLTRQVLEVPQTASVEAATVEDPKALVRALQDWQRQVRAGDYIALQAFLAPSPETTALLQDIRRVLRDRFRVATTLGYGPRFLHSTGQLHKGGPATGRFLQLVDEPVEDIPIPETDFTFGRLLRAQAEGDARALVERGRRVLRVDLGRDVSGGLERLWRVLASG